MIYTLRKRFSFEAAHRLPHHDGKCQRLHGHSWVGWVEVESNTVQLDGPAAGMVMDYGAIAAILELIVQDHLDHHYLNETLELESPTAEAVAQWVWRHLRDGGLEASAVTIEETCTSVCIYRPATR